MIKNIKKNKKAQFFSLMAVLLIVLMFVTFEIFSFMHGRDVIRTRVSTMDSFMKAVEDNLEKQVYIAGYRTLFLAGNYVVDEGVYLGQDTYYTSSEPVLQFFNESFLNGELAGVEQAILFTYSDMADSLQEKADKMNIEINLSDSPVISVSQQDPWNVNFSVTFNLSMTDKENLARWQREETVSVLIPITNFKDPLYDVETYNKVPRLIRRTPYSSFDTASLIDHIDKGYYKSNIESPSFLNRLIGNFSPSDNGIESFVVRPNLSLQGLSSPEKSCVDYIYFSSNNPSYSAVSGVYEGWFRLDSNHTAIYVS
jgi:hypothetical protein